MVRIIEEAMRAWSATGICIVNNPVDCNLKIETMNGNVFIQVNKDMDLTQVLESCSIDTDAAIHEVASQVATKMCNFIQDTISSLITTLDVNHENNQAIEHIIYKHRDFMLDYITEDFMDADEIRGG